MKRLAPLLLLPLLALGCAEFPAFPLGDPMLGTPLKEVAANSFGASRASAFRGKPNFPPGSQETAWKVDAVGRKLLQTNQEIGLKPYFATINHADAEVFHIGDNIIYVTDGLVNRCRTEGELATVLATELAKIVAERERHTPAEVRSPERLPPVRLPIGGGGQAEASDPTYRIERAKYEREKQAAPASTRATPPRLDEMARRYLAEAGYTKADYDAAQPLLQLAQRNCQLEMQLTGPGMQGSWK